MFHTSSHSPHRTAEELSFAFSVLLTLELPHQEAAFAFQRLWDETNDAATACLPEASAFIYIELLRDMDRRWRSSKTLH